MLDLATLNSFLIPGTPPDVVQLYASLPERAAGQLELVEEPVIIMDTETTGLDHAHDQLIEIAAVRMEGPKVVAEFQTFVNPGCAIPEEITELTGIANSDVAGAPDPGTAVDMFAEFASGADIVAHNASFDRSFVMREAVPGAITGEWLDSLTLAHIVLPRFRSHRLSDIASAFGTPRGTHRAMDDVVALASVWRILLAAVHALPPGMAAKIAELAPDTHWSLRTVFQRAAGAQSEVDFSLRRLRDVRAGRRGAETAASLRDAFSAGSFDDAPRGCAASAAQDDDIPAPGIPVLPLKGGAGSAALGAAEPEGVNPAAAQGDGLGDVYGLPLQGGAAERSEPEGVNRGRQAGSPCGEPLRGDSAPAFEPFSQAKTAPDSCPLQGEPPVPSSRTGLGRSLPEAVVRDPSHVWPKAASTSGRGAESAAVAPVAPAAPKTDAAEVPLRYPTDREVRSAFSPNGLVGAMYPDYEPRSEQVDMALEVAHAFADSACAAIEAGTGVGKSMAYLVPAVRLAWANGITVGVATKTNALMDQLVYSELPRLAQHTPGLNYLALKGYDHYPCLRKLERYMATTSETGRENIEMVATLLNYTAQTAEGDLDALNLHWVGMQRNAIEASPNDCLKSRCPFYPKRCFLHGARKRAHNADIVVTNHALLFCDVQRDNGILPPIRHWVIDEAHTVEAEARKQLSLQIGARDLSTTLNRLTNTRTGTLAMLRRRAGEVSGGSVLYGVTADIDERASQVLTIATSFFSFVKDLRDPREQGNANYDRVTLWVGPELRSSGAWATIEAPGRSLVKKLDGLVKRLRDLMSTCEQFEGMFAEQQADLANHACKLAEMEDALVLVLEGDDTSYVYSVELDRNPDRLFEVLKAEKFDIGEELANNFYDNVMSVVYTSATIATGDAREPFGHFRRTSGLALLPQQRVRCRKLDSSYDFDHNMQILLPSDLPEPNAKGFRPALAELLFSVHCAMGGSVLTLFTNRREMEALYEQLKGRLADEGIDVAAQLRGINNKTLRDRFLAERELSLFALRSFWEGFDAPGDTLRCVVIPRLPFGRPTDPIARERELRESRQAWARYSLPEAVVDLKQAAGRLIRKSTDSGFLVLADARLQTKSYGKVFLNAMPTSNIKRATSAEIARIISASR